MLKHTFLLSLITFPLLATPAQKTSLEKLEDQLEDVEADESTWSEEEELSLLHKKGSRPQVIEIPTKTALTP